MDNIFDYAMEKEKYSHDYYEDLAEKCGDEGLKYILATLALEENNHYVTIKNMKKGDNSAPPVSNLLKEAKITFAKMRDSKENFNFNISQVELYKKAQEIEKNSKKYYLSKMNELIDKKQKEIFKELADEEEKHYKLLDNIIELITKPEIWLENAEFNHLDEF